MQHIVPRIGGAHEIGFSYIDRTFGVISRLSLSVGAQRLVATAVDDIHQLDFQLVLCALCLMTYCSCFLNAPILLTWLHIFNLQ